MPPEAIEEELIIPDGCLELLFHYGDPFFLKRDDKWVRQERSVFSGQLSSSIALKPGGRAGIISAKFTVAGAHSFVKDPLNEYTDHLINCSEVFGNEGVDLEDMIEEARDTTGRISLIESFLVAKLASDITTSISTARVVDLIVAHSGRASINEIRKSVGVGERNLERHFLSQIGLTPKSFSKLIRLKSFVDTVDANPHLNLTAAALDCGYYDQAHLIRDFQQIVGIKPTEYFQSQHYL